MLKKEGRDIIDTSIGTSRYNFWELNKDKASVTKRTFYRRINEALKNGENLTFEEALTSPSSTTKATVKSVDEINTESSKSFFDDYMSNSGEDDEVDTDEDDLEDDELSFGGEKIKAPVGA